MVTLQYTTYEPNFINMAHVIMKLYNDMRFSRNQNRSSNGVLFNALARIILTSFVIPFIIRVVKKKLEEKQRLLCYKCHGKLELIHKGEYYCKNCKIIRKDHN